jgi:hypothetical protein
VDSRLAGKADVVAPGTQRVVSSGTVASPAAAGLLYKDYDGRTLLSALPELFRSMCSGNRFVKTLVDVDL